jgi:outer membrane lipoprotein-sorting protein
MKFKLNKSFFVVLAGVIFIGTPMMASGAPTIEEIATAVKNAEDSVQDLTIEYTAVRRPYGSKGRDLTAAEQKRVNKYPGKYKASTGVFKIKGDKIRLDRTLYRSTSTTKTITDTIAYDGQTTVSQSTRIDNGLVTAGLWHGFRAFINPWRALTVRGVMKLSEELKNMGANILPDLEEVNGTSCRVVKLYRKVGATVRRSYKAYLDPARNYAVVRVEEYWYDFEELSSVMQVNSFTRVNSLYIPEKALVVRYHKSNGKPHLEYEMEVTNISSNQNVSDSVFSPNFPVGTRVWHEALKTHINIGGQR